MTGIRRRLEKNLPELQAFSSGQMPSWVVSGKSNPSHSVPVFVFHGVGPDRFAAQLRYLVENGYRTLNAEELTARLSASDSSTDDDRNREVVLTFDDASWSLWSYAFPLLRHYSLTAIVFAIPGLTIEEASPLPRLDLTGWTTGASLPNLSASRIRERVNVQPLCTWRELQAMAEGGILDVQSHSLFHARVEVAPRIIDFHHPQFDADYYGNVGLPLRGAEDVRSPVRSLEFGFPVLENASRFADQKRFVADAGFGLEGPLQVKSEGDGAFFARQDWRKSLRHAVGEPRGRFESEEEQEEAIRHEMKMSKSRIEERLGCHVTHFCYPWFQGSNRSDQIASELGYTTTHYGIGEPFVSSGAMRGAGGVWRLPRVSEEYVERLPGDAQRSILSIWRDRVRRAGHPRGLGI